MGMKRKMDSISKNQSWNLNQTQKSRICRPGDMYSRKSYGHRRIGAQDPPDKVALLGYYAYPCADLLICKASIEDVPYFNANIYLENKVSVGKIDEIFGNPQDYYVSIKLNEYIKKNSFKANQKLYIDPAKLLPLTRFQPQVGTSRNKVRVRQGVPSKQKSWGRVGWQNCRKFGRQSKPHMFNQYRRKNHF